VYVVLTAKSVKAGHDASVIMERFEVTAMSKFSQNIGSKSPKTAK